MCIEIHWNSLFPLSMPYVTTLQYREIFWQNGSLLYGSDTAKQEFFMRLQLRLQSLHKHDFISNQLLFYCWLTQQHFNFSVSFSFKYNGSALSRVRSTKCLGVIIDENLLWHEHVDFLCKKVIASLSMLKRIRNFLDERDLLLLYNCLIQSQLDYCCEVWGSRYDVHANRLEILQKRAARMILNANFYTLLSVLIYYRFKKRVMYFRCIFIFKCINDLSSDLFKDTFLDVSLSHYFNTRYSTRGNLILPKCNTEYLKKSFIYSAINQWNLLPNHLKVMESIFSFKSNLKQYLLS